MARGAPVSHRALVSRARRDGGFDVVPWRDGADDDVLVRLCTPGARLPPTAADDRPLGRADSVEAVLTTYLDPVEHEALLVVDRDGRVTPHAVVAYVLGTRDGLVQHDPAGAVLALVGEGGSGLHPAYVRGWTHGTEALAWLDDRTRRLAGDQYAFGPVPARRE